MAKPRESYNECALRMFGNCLAPNLISPDDDVTEDCLFVIISDLFNVKDAIPDTVGTQIQSFVIGQNKFDDEGAYGDYEEEPDPRLPCAVSWHVMKLPFMARIAHQLRYLELTLYISYDDMSDMDDIRPQQILSMLNHASNLEFLRLRLQFPAHCLFVEGTVANTICETDIKARFFESMFRGIELPQLRTLDLQGFYIAAEPLQSFAKAHIDSLKDLHLISCAFVRPQEAAHVGQAALAKWAGENLYLEGAEVSCSAWRTKDHESDAIPHYPNDSFITWFNDPGFERFVDLYEQGWVGERMNRTKRRHFNERLESSKEIDWWLKPR